MTKNTEATLTRADIPAPVAGGARYGVRMSLTGGYDVTMFDGITSVIDHKRAEQSAIRCAIRWQKRENAAVTKSDKRAK